MVSCSCSPTRGGAAEAPCGPTTTPSRRASRSWASASPSSRRTAGPSTERWRSTCLSPRLSPSVHAGAGAARPAGGLRPHRGAARDRPGGAARAPSSGCSGRTAPGRRTTLAAISGQLSPTGGQHPHDGRRRHRCPARGPGPRGCLHDPRGPWGVPEPHRRREPLDAHATGAPRSATPARSPSATSRCSPSAGTCSPGTSPAASSRCSSLARALATDPRCCSSTSSRWAWRR